MKFSALDVIEIDNINFKLLSAKILVSIINKSVFFNEEFLKIFLEPLLSEKFSKQYVEDITYAIKKKGAEFCKTSYSATFLMFKGVEKYRVYLERQENCAEGFLLYKLSPEEMRDIKSKAIMESDIKEEDLPKNNMH